MPYELKIWNHTTGTVWTHAKEKEAFGLTDDQLLLTSPIVYGFSLADKFWRTFSCHSLSDILTNICRS